MNFDAIRIKNLRLSDELRTFLDNVLERLQASAPLLATFMPTLEYADGKYTCTIEVTSHLGNFVATSTTYFPEAAILRTESKIKSKLWGWRAMHIQDFVYPPTSNPSQNRDGSHRDV